MSVRANNSASTIYTEIENVTNTIVKVKRQLSTMKSSNNKNRVWKKQKKLRKESLVANE